MDEMKKSLYKIMIAMKMANDADRERAAKAAMENSSSNPQRPNSSNQSASDSGSARR